MKETKENKKKIKNYGKSTNLGSKNENQKDKDFSLSLDVLKIDDIYVNKLEKLKNYCSLKSEYHTLSYPSFLFQLISYIDILNDLYLYNLVEFEKTVKDLSIKVIVNKSLKKTNNSLKSFLNPNKEDGENKDKAYTFDLFSMFYLLKYHNYLSKDFNISDVPLSRIEIINRKYNKEKDNYDDDMRRFIFSLIESNPKNRPSFEQIYNNKSLNDIRELLEEKNLLDVDEEKLLIEIEKRLKLRKMDKKEEKTKKYNFKKKKLKE